MKFSLILLLVCLAIHNTDAAFMKAVSRGQITCDANHCNPNWTPFENLPFALRGYNMRQGNPYSESGDPGFVSQIFVPTVLNKQTSTYSLSDGITAVDLNYCKRTMRSQSFTNIKSYRDYVTSTSSSGVNLQIGVEREVTAGVDIKGVSASSKSTIPPPFTRAWGDSNGMKKLKKFFSQEKGMMTLQMGLCFSYEVQLDTHYLPMFTTPFKAAIIHLNKASSMNYAYKKSAFFKFIRQYGTHFTIKTKLGAQFIHETRYSSKIRENFNSETLRECSQRSGAKIFGIQVEKDSSKCTSSDQQKLNNMKRGNIEEVTITKGSRPDTIRKWSIQEFTPVPLQFQLSPIVNLFTNGNFKRNDINVNGIALRRWFLPMFWDYCKIVGVPCNPPTGCGYDDLCPIDTICSGNGKTHQCTAWSGWSCTQNCGNGKQQKRTRKCYGCSGKTYEVRNHNCKRQNPCYLAYRETRRYTGFNSEGRGKSEYLDRHWMACPNGMGIRGFRLERNGRGNYRYNYLCGTIRYPVSPILKINSRTYNGKGDMVYLDRQYVNCPPNSVISQVGLRRSGNSNWYRYVCSRLTYGRQHCTAHTTPFSYDGNGNTVYLDRQHVMCPHGSTLSTFKLERNGAHNHVRYRITCCRTIR